MIFLEIDYKKIGYRISQRRKELKIRQSDLAKVLDISDNHVSNIENGHNPPSLKTFLELCNALNTTPDYFLLGNIKMTPSENINDMLKLCTPEELEMIQKLLETYLFDKKDYKI